MVKFDFDLSNSYRIEQNKNNLLNSLPADISGKLRVDSNGSIFGEAYNLESERFYVFGYRCNIIEDKIELRAKISEDQFSAIILGFKNENEKHGSFCIMNRFFNKKNFTGQYSGKEILYSPSNVFINMDMILYSIIKYPLNIKDKKMYIPDKYRDIEIISSVSLNIEPERKFII